MFVKIEMLVRIEMLVKIEILVNIEIFVKIEIMLKSKFCSNRNFARIEILLKMFTGKLKFLVKIQIVIANYNNIFGILYFTLLFLSKILKFI